MLNEKKKFKFINATLTLQIKPKIISYDVYN